MDMNMNVLWRDPEKVLSIQQNRMTRFWGDESWKSAAYSGDGNLFGGEGGEVGFDRGVRGFEREEGGHA